MTTPYISMDVVFSLAKSGVTDWVGANALAFDQINNHYGLSKDDPQHFAKFEEAMRNFVIAKIDGLDKRPEIIDVQNYLDLSMGSRYFQAVRHPFPQGNVLESMRAVTETTMAADNLKEIFQSFQALQAPELGNKTAVQLGILIFENALSLKEFAPTTTFEAICTIIPLDKIPLPSHFRKMVESALSIALKEPVSLNAGVPVRDPVRPTASAEAGEPAPSIKHGFTRA